MDTKTLSKILPTMVGIGFCIVEAVKIFVLRDSATAPNSGTGHTEPALFAPAISTDWSYVTHSQILLMTVVTGTVLLLAVLMFALQWRTRWLAMREDAPAGETPSNPASPRTSSRPDKSFGRARRG